MIIFTTTKNYFYNLIKCTQVLNNPRIHSYYYSNKNADCHFLYTHSAYKSIICINKNILQLMFGYGLYLLNTILYYYYIDM